jgi:hypothetical protein
MTASARKKAERGISSSADESINWKFGSGKCPVQAGQRFGMMTLVSPAGSKNGLRMVLAKCDCGNIKIVPVTFLRNGTTKSCGHLKLLMGYVNNRRHGHSCTGLKTITYASWRGMMERCYRRAHKSFKNYGGRGIRVCKRWHTFDNFLADMGERPPGLTIDRINNSKNYSKANCRWATVKEQNRNSRSAKRVRFGGFTGCLSEHAERNGLKASVVHARLRYLGWSMKQALSRPSRFSTQATERGES